MEPVTVRQEQIADRVGREIITHLKDEVKGLYRNIAWMAPGADDRSPDPKLFLHRSEAVDLGARGGATFILYLVDHGDIEYEPRLQQVERALLRRADVLRVVRDTAPDTMVKDMLCVEIRMPA